MRAEMSKKEKLIKRLKSKPTDFTYDDAESLLLSLGFAKFKAGKTGGSRVKFMYSSTALMLHKPHPRNVLEPYQVNKIIKFLKRMELI